jgi:putative glycosyltransferase (TIGR04372 family)
MADLGYHAIRMGSAVRKQLDSYDAKIVDYASSEDRSELLDLFLSARCHFFLSGSSGLASVPMAFRRPRIMANLITLPNVRGTHKDIVLPKRLWHIRDRRFLTFDEMIERWSFGFYKNYRENGIEVIDNSHEELKSATIEMHERLVGEWESAEDDERLQRLFKTQFMAKVEWVNKEALRNGQARPLGHASIPWVISAAFLKDNADLLQPAD